MATHCSVPAWDIHGQRSLVDYGLWGYKQPEARMHTQLTIGYNTVLY